MLKVLVFNLSRLRNDEHFNYMTDVNKILSAALVSRIAGFANAGIDSLFTIFKELLQKEDEAIVVLRKSELTDPIADADTLRDEVYRGLTLFVEAYSNSIETEQREAARRIMVLIDNHGDPRKRSYNEETSAIYNLVEDLRGKQGENVEAIGAEEWVEALSKTNELFQNAMNERYSESQDAVVEKVRQIRVEVDAVYRELVTLLEISNRLDETAYVDVIGAINERAEYYKNTLAVRKGKTDAKKEEEIND